MDAYQRAGRAQKSASKQALRELGVPKPDLKAAGAKLRCMPRPKIVKGRTREEQQRIDADNAAMAAAARRREQALRQEQKARRRALALAEQTLGEQNMHIPGGSAEPKRCVAAACAPRGASSSDCPYGHPAV